LSGDYRENCRVENTELQAVYLNDLGRPSPSGFNTARKPTLQVNEVVLLFALSQINASVKKGNKGGTAYIRPLQS